MEAISLCMSEANESLSCWFTLLGSCFVIEANVSLGASFEVVLLWLLLSALEFGCCGMARLVQHTWPGHTWGFRFAPDHGLG